MKGAESEEVLSPAFELHKGGNDFDNVVCRPYFIDFIVRDPHGERKIRQYSERWKREGGMAIAERGIME